MRVVLVGLVHSHNTRPWQDVLCCGTRELAVAWDSTCHWQYWQRFPNYSVMITMYLPSPLSSSASSWLLGPYVQFTRKHTHRDVARFVTVPEKEFRGE